MEHRILGRTGLSVSVLGFGGAEIGFEDAPQNVVETLLNAALDAGLNTIDTGECYAGSEEKIGLAVSHRRSDFHLFTKVGHASGLEGGDWTPSMMAASIDRSLRRLRVETVDLVQLHSCSEDLLRQGDVIDVLRSAQQAGKIRFLGYSGDSDAALYAVTCGAFDTLQTSISVADQQPLTLTLPEAREQNMGVIAKRPIANAAWRYGATAPDNAYLHTYWERLQTLQYDFLSGDDAAEIALRWTLFQPGVSTAIVGTANPQRWPQNAALAAKGPLLPQQSSAIAARWSEAGGAEWPGQN